MSNENKEIKIKFINFKDKKNNAISFLNELGNPYNFVAKDLDGRTSEIINLASVAAYSAGVINYNKKNCRTNRQIQYEDILN